LLARQLLADVDRSGFDIVGEYAEPLPVLVIAELLGVDPSTATQLRVWSQAIVRMYEPSPSPEVVDAAVSAAQEFADLVREVARQRAASPRDDLISDLVRSSVLVSDPTDDQPLTEDEVVASAVLLLNAGHEASVNVFGNGLVGFLRSGALVSTGSTAGSVELLVEEMLRFDSALQLFERTATQDVDVAGVQVRKGQKIAALLGAANRDPDVFEAPDEFRTDRDPNPHLAFGAGLHFCVGSPLARMELAESLALLLDEVPDLQLAGEPESRGTFVLHGYRSVMVSA
jgi:unspecific monooxygenase